MAKVFVVTDSTADIPKDLERALGITVVPLKVHIQEKTYLDGETITPVEFYEKLKEADHLPTTSQPSPLDFVQTYQRLAAEDKEAKIISIHLSAALSGTVQSAQLAKEMVSEDGIEVTVFDTKKASYSIGIIVVAVAEAIKQGKKYDELISITKELINQTEVYFMVDTLTYLQKGGRIGKAASLFGSLLNIKPILTLNEQGEVFPVDKVRGTNKAFQKTIQLLSKDAGDSPVRLGISHAVNESQALKLTEMIKEKLDVTDFVLTEIGPVIGTHVGPGTIAVMILKQKAE